MGYCLPRCFGCLTERRRPENRVSEDNPESIQELIQAKSHRFSFNDLSTATKRFSKAGLIGEGGFGFVYKGWIDEKTFNPTKPGTGIPIAVKKLKTDRHQGHKEWLSEVTYLEEFEHPNLVRLIGFSTENDQRILVYEFVEQGSLEKHLFKKVEPLSWKIRMKIGLGIARGLAFLHNREVQVIYRDLKPSNILLDLEFNVKLSDFGLARQGPTGDRSYITTQVFGTEGYAAPEYINSGRLSAKSDVYSFGVVLLELLSGHRAIENSRSMVERDLVQWARPLLNRKRKFLRVMDTSLEGQYPSKAAYVVANLAYQCVDLDPKNRPDMTYAVYVLEKLRDAQGTREIYEVINGAEPKS